MLLGPLAGAGRGAPVLDPKPTRPSVVSRKSLLLRFSGFMGDFGNTTFTAGVVPSSGANWRGSGRTSV